MHMNLQVTIESLSPIRKKIKVEVPHAEYLKELEAAYQNLSKKVALKGFRKGKVPRNILEKYYKDETESKTLSHLIEHSYSHALQDHRIEPVAPPKITDLNHEPGKSVSYVAEVEVRPKLENLTYKAIPLKKPSVEPTEEEIGQQLKALQERQAEIRPVEENVAVKTGHQVIIDFEGRLNGELFDGGSAKNVTMEVGKGSFLKDFEEGVVGLKKGESKIVPVSFPENYPEPKLAGKQAEFQIAVQDIKEKILPALDDDFAKDIGEYETLAEVRENISKTITAQKEKAVRGEFYKQILDDLISKHAFEVPEVMVERELDAMLENVQNRLKSQGLTLEQMGETIPSFREKTREDSLRRVKAFLLFEAIAEAEKIRVLPEEMRARIEEIAKSVGETIEKVERYYHENNLFGSVALQILEQKVLNFLIQEAKLL